MGLLLLAALGLLVLGGKGASSAASPKAEAKADAFEEDAPGMQTPVLPAAEDVRRKSAMAAIKKLPASAALATTEKVATKKTSVAKKKLAATKQTQVSRKSKLAPKGLYTIRNTKKGGTLEAVAKLFMVSLAAIQAANPALNVVTTYKAGTKVRIP